MIFAAALNKNSIIMRVYLIYNDIFVMIAVDISHFNDYARSSERPEIPPYFQQPMRIGKRDTGITIMDYHEYHENFDRH
jgi:hypothetical protein